MDEKAIESIIENEKEWRRFLTKKIDNIEIEQISQGKSIAQLKVKASLWGLIGGTISSGAVIVAAFLKSKL